MSVEGRWTDGFKFSTPRLPLLYYNILLLFIVGICYQEEIRKKNRYKTKYFKWQRQPCTVAERESPAINNRILLYYIYCVKVSIPISRRSRIHMHIYYIGLHENTMN